MTVTHRPPESTEYHSFYANYVRQVPAGEIHELLHDQQRDVEQFFGGIEESRSLILHPPYTWTFKQVVGHLIDCERIFGYRILRIASGDQTPLPGFEQDDYILNSDYETPKFRDLVEELLDCRKANRALLGRLQPSAWDNRAVASGHPITVRALAYILYGHIQHHLKILKQRAGSVPD